MAINYHDGGGNDPYTPDFTDVNVVPEDLADFADLLDNDLKALGDTWDRLRADMESQPVPNFPGEHPDGIGYPNGYPEIVHTGSGGLYEARDFTRAYFLTVDAEWRLVRDVIRGLEVLRDAARMIHDGYVASDAGNAGDVERAFTAYERSSVIDALGESDPPSSVASP